LISASVIGRLLYFLWLIGNAKRSFHTTRNATYGAANDGANRAPNRACRPAPFPGPLACAFLGTANNALCIGDDRRRQKSANCCSQPPHFHVRPPKEIKGAVK
jgi:hypothetical protein